MNVSKEELMHIAKLAKLKIADEKIAEYQKNLDDILTYIEVLNNAPTAELDETIGANDNKNVFRKDEVKKFDNIKGMLDNAPDMEDEMYKIPKVIQ